MPFQLIVNNRVAEKVETLDQAVSAAEHFLQQPIKPSLEIVDLGGRVYRDSAVSALVDDLRGRSLAKRV